MRANGQCGISEKPICVVKSNGSRYGTIHGEPEVPPRRTSGLGPMPNHVSKTKKIRSRMDHLFLSVSSARTCPTPIFEDRPSSSSVLDTKIRAQEQLIANYKAELDQQKRVLQEALLTTEAQAVQIQNLEQELGSLKQVNASLMQDNESYQILLHEKTMAGEIFKVSEPNCLGQPYPFIDNHRLLLENQRLCC